MAWAGNAGKPRRALERDAVPAPGSGRLVGALEEGEQRRVGIGRSPDGIIGQEKLAERLAEERRLRLDSQRFEAIRYRVGVRVECRMIDAATPGQNPALLTSWG